MALHITKRRIQRLNLCRLGWHGRVFTHAARAGAFEASWRQCARCDKTIGRVAAQPVVYA